MLYKDSQDIIICYVLFSSGVDYEFFLENCKAHYFSKVKYTRVYDVIKDLVERNIEITPNIIMMNLKVTDYMDLMDEHSATSFVEFKEAIKVLKTGFVQKQIKTIMSEELEKLSSDLTNTELEIAIEQVKNRLDDIQVDDKITTKQISDISSEYMVRLDEIKSGKTNIGLNLGYKSLDRFLNGRLDGNRVIVLGAYESIGKTAVGLNFALQLLKQGKKVLLFSLEMSENQLMDRLVAIESGIELSKLKTNEQLTDEEYNRIGQAILTINNSNLSINVDLNITSEKMMSYALKLKKQQGLDFIIIDYLQLLGQNESGKDERSGVNISSRNIKRMAKVLDLPVLAMSQVSRDSQDPLGFKIPTRKKLKESGNIEADADIIIMAHRHLYDADGTHSPKTVQKEMFLIVDKNRDGERGPAKMLFELDNQRLIDIIA